MSQNPQLQVRISANVDELKRNLAEGKAQIEALGPSVAKLASTWSANSAALIQNARNITVAIEQIGASTLTTADAGKNLRVLEAAMAQLRATGQAIPALMQETADKLRAVGSAASTTVKAVQETAKALDSMAAGMSTAGKTSAASINLIGGMSSAGAQAAAKLKETEAAMKGVSGAGVSLTDSLSKVAGTFGIAFGASALVAGAKAMISHVMDTAAQVHDLAEKLDVSSEAVQRWSYAAKQTGTDMDTVQRSVAFMNKTLAGGDDSTVKALNAAGLQFESIRAMAPEQAFNTIVGAIQNIPDPMTQARVAVELFGKAGQDLLPAIKEGFQRIGAEAYVMADGTINALEAAGDAIDRFKNVATTRLGQAAGAAVLAFEEISKGREGIANWWKALQESGGQDDKFIASLTKIRNAANALTEDQKALIKVEVENGEANDLLAIGINANKDSIVAYANSLRKAADEAKKAGQVQGTTTEELAAANHKWEESARKAQARTDEFAAAMAELNSVGEGWRGTLDTIDGRFVEAIKYYLQAGVSQGKLATAYQLTDAQVKAVASSLANEVEITKKATEAAKVLSDIRNQVEAGTFKLNEALTQSNSTELITIKQTLELAAAMHMVEQSIPPAVAGFHSLGMDSLANLGQRSTEIEDLQVKLKGIAHPVDQVALAVNGLATSFGQLGQQIGGTAGLIMTAAGGMQQAFAQMHAAQAAANMPGASADTIAAAARSRSAFTNQAVGMGAGIAAGMIDTSGQAGTGSLVASGALTGAAAGSVAGPWGMAVGAGAGAIIGLVRAGKEWRQVVNDIARDFGGIKVSDDFAKMIEDLEKSTGLGSAQAITTQLDQLVKLSGGLDSKNLTQFTQKLHDAFSYIETKTMSVAQVTQVLDKNFAEFAKAGTDNMGRLNDQMREIIRLDERFGTQSKAVAEYLQQQGAAAITGFNAVVAGTKDASDGYANIKKSIESATSAAKLLSGTDVSSSLMDVIGSMGVSERDALKSGFADAVKAGFSGTMTEFLSQQATLYQFAQEGDSRFKTWLSGSTMHAFADIQSKASGALSSVIDKMGEAERGALQSGFVDAVNSGFKGTLSGFLAQQAALYQTAKEGDERLKTWLSGSTIDMIKATGPANDLVNAIAAQQNAAEAAKQELSDLGIQAVASFAAAVASGTSMSDALTAIHPSLQTLKQSYADLGLNVDNVALANLMMQDTILSGNPALASAISGLSSEMAALDNMGLLNVDTFGAMERTGWAMYTRLQAAAAAAGGTTKDALLPMQDYLHQAEIQAKLLGIPLDDNTQELINQSTALGIWKDAGKTANDLLLDGMTRLVDKVSMLIDNLNGVTSSINNIPRTVDINVQGHYIAPSIPDGGGGDVDWGGAQASGGDYFVRRPTLFLAGEAGPERASFSGGGKTGGGGMSTAAMEDRLANIERLMRDQPRAMAIAVSDAVALRR